MRQVPFWCVFLGSICSGSTVPWWVKKGKWPFSTHLGVGVHPCVLTQVQMYWDAHKGGFCWGWRCKEENLYTGYSPVLWAEQDQTSLSLRWGQSWRGNDWSKFPPFTLFFLDALTQITNASLDGFTQKQCIFTICGNYSFETGKACASLSALFLEVMEKVFQPDYCLWREEFPSIWPTTCWYFISVEPLKSL